VGDVLFSFPSPSPISSCRGICDDGNNLWVTDADGLSTKIYEVSYDGEYTGISITVSLGQSWIGDMVSDGDWLYCILVGGPNSIVKIDLATGETVETITGDWTGNSQQGLSADFVNEEFYIGGWNSNRIWRTTFDGTTISTFDFNGVSGLAWHPAGGPDAEGSLWVVESTPEDLVTEIDPNNGWVTIQSFSIPNGQLYTGAGAEMKNSGNNQGALWIPNRSDNTIYLVDVAEPFSCCPPEILPDNLLGYNVYRDNDFIAFTPHVPPGVYVPQGYVDEGLSPGWYQYTITAVYDLAEYGFPGETDESVEEGPAEISACSCFDLDFTETWATGNFDHNNWNVGGANWTVNSQAGNPEPAAEFTWDPVQEDYSIGLESYPITALGMTEGRIWFDFDLKLDAAQPTGEEKLQAQVWNWDSQLWVTVGEYSNAEGSFGWTSRHINIKAQAMNQVFKVRFLASGANSINIVSWFVDNIHIYRMCDGITDLAATALDQVGIVLSWTDPNPGQIDQWIHWDDGVNSGNSIGTGGAEEWDVAVRWEPEQLADYEGAAVTQIAFFPVEPTTSYSVRVWIGENAANLVVDQAIVPVCGEWNTVTLSYPVPLDITQELWIGYHVITPTGYPAGVDDGPAIDGYGNMVNIGTWQTLLEINPDFDWNWNIAAHLLTTTGVSVPLSRSVKPNINPAGMTIAFNPGINKENHVFAPEKSSRELMGLNIYRSVNGGGYEFFYFYTGGFWAD
jgi:hypothetical protein